VCGPGHRKAIDPLHEDSTFAATVGTSVPNRCLCCRSFSKKINSHEVAISIRRRALGPPDSPPSCPRLLHVLLIYSPQIQLYFQRAPSHLVGHPAGRPVECCSPYLFTMSALAGIVVVLNINPASKNKVPLLGKCWTKKIFLVNYWSNIGPRSYVYWERTFQGSWFSC
jgi:hypothetical protein